MFTMLVMSLATLAIIMGVHAGSVTDDVMLKGAHAAIVLMGLGGLVAALFAPDEEEGIAAVKLVGSVVMMTCMIVFLVSTSGVVFSTEEGFHLFNIITTSATGLIYMAAIIQTAVNAILRR